MHACPLLCNFAARPINHFYYVANQCSDGLKFGLMYWGNGSPRGSLLRTLTDVFFFFGGGRHILQPGYGKIALVWGHARQNMHAQVLWERRVISYLLLGLRAFGIILTRKCNLHWVRILQKTETHTSTSVNQIFLSAAIPFMSTNDRCNFLWSDLL